MHRFAPLAVVLALSLCAATAEAAKKKKAQGTVVGTIAAVSADGKSISVVQLGRKKKMPGPTTQVKLGERTRVSYIGLDSKDEQKLAVGRFVMVALDQQDTGTGTDIAVGHA